MWQRLWQCRPNRSRRCLIDVKEGIVTGRNLVFEIAPSRQTHVEVSADRVLSFAPRPLTWHR